MPKGKDQFIRRGVAPSRRIPAVRSAGFRPYAWLGVVLALMVGCGGGEKTRRERSEKRTPRATVGAPQTQATKQLRAAMPEFLVERVRSDAARYLGSAAERQERRPTEDEKALAFYRSLRLLARLAQANDWPTSQTLKDTVERLMARELRSKVYRDAIGEITASDAEIQEYYNENIETYQTKGSFTTRYIFLNVVDHPDLKEEKRALGNKILTELKSGKPFEEMVRQYSEDDSKDEPPEPFPFGEINPELEKVIVALEPGEISGLVESKYGFNIFRLEKIERPTTTPLEAVRDEIEQQILRRKGSKASLEVADKLKARYPAQTNYPPLNDPKAAGNAAIIESDFLRVTLDDYKKKVESIPPSARPALDRPEDKERFVDQWIESERLRYAIEDQKLESDPEMIAVREYLTSRTLASTAMTELAAKVPEPTDDEIRGLYEATPQISVRPERVRLRELVVGYNVPADATRRQVFLAMKEAETSASAIAARLEAGADFVEAVRKHSTARSAEKDDGDLGLVTLQSRSAEAIAALEGLQPGQWTKPILEPGKNGFTIYKLEERVTEEKIPLDDARRNQVVNLLMRQKRGEYISRIQLALAEAFRADMTVEEIRKIVDGVEAPAVESP